MAKETKAEYKVGDNVIVIPERPNYWTDSLYKWINGRRGIIKSVRWSLIENCWSYTLRFKAKYRKEGDLWICKGGDLVAKTSKKRSNARNRREG